jgi:hypothetical protein
MRFLRKAVQKPETDSKPCFDAFFGTALEMQRRQLFGRFPNGQNSTHSPIGGFEGE